MLVCLLSPSSGNTEQRMNRVGVCAGGRVAAVCRMESGGTSNGSRWSSAGIDDG